MSILTRSMAPGAARWPLLIWAPSNAGAPKTAHSLNPVPIYIFDPNGTVKMKLSSRKDLGISSIAATCLKLLGFEPPEDFTPSIIDLY